VRADGDGAGQGVNSPSPAESSAKPLAGNGFDPSRIYAARSSGVVTIYALFGTQTDDGSGGTSQGTGFVVSPDGYILTNSHVITTAGEGTPADTAEQADTVYVEFRSGERVSATVVGFDPFDDVGLVKIDGALDPGADLYLRPRRCDSDRRSDQPGELRRPALRRAWPRDRDQRTDPKRHRKR
jgi:S1-C subfamily serine protease